MRFAARFSPRSDLGRAVGVADFNRLIRDAEIQNLEILDVRVAEQSLQVAVEAATTNHGHERKGVIAQHPFELCLEPGNGLFPIIGEGVSRRHDGAHADSGDDAYGEPRFVDGSDDPCMRESARAAAAEDKADFAPRDISHDTIKVVLVAGSYMKMPVDVAFVQPAYGALRSGRPGRMKQDESLPEPGMSGIFLAKDLRFHFGQIRRGGGRAERNDFIRLPDTTPGPIGQTGIGDVNQVPDARLLLVEPRAKAQVFRAAFRRLRDTGGAEKPVRLRAGDEKARLVPGQ